MNKYSLDFDLLTSADEVSIVCTRLKDGDKKWELFVGSLKYDIEPDDPSMDDQDDHNLDVWCFCDFVDINFWRDSDPDIIFSIYPVDEVTEDNADSWGMADIGSTFTNTNVRPVRGVVEFKNEK
jgi:hypothetical protein